MLARKWQLPGSDISNTVVKELKFSISQTGYQQNPGKQVNYEKPQEIGSNCHKEPALTFLSKVVAAFRYHQRRHGLYTDALRFLCTYKYVISGNGHSRVSWRILPMMSISTGRKTAARSSRINVASIHGSIRRRSSLTYSALTYFAQGMLRGKQIFPAQCTARLLIQGYCSRAFGGCIVGVFP